MLDTHDSVTALQEAMSMVLALTEPGRALGARFDAPCDEFMRYAYRLKQLAAFARAPRDAMTIEAWCQQILEAAAAEHPHAAEHITAWCNRMLDRFEDAEDDEEADKETPTDSE